MKKILFLILFVSMNGFAGEGVTEITAPQKCEKETTADMECETKTECTPVKIKTVVKEKIVYKDRFVPVEKIVYKDKIVYRDRPVEKIVEKFIDRPIPAPLPVEPVKEEQPKVGDLNLSLLAGMGSDGFYTELDPETNEYTMSKDFGAVAGLYLTLRLNDRLTLGAGALSNETYFGSIGVNVGLFN